MFGTGREVGRQRVRFFCKVEGRREKGEGKVKGRCVTGRGVGRYRVSFFLGRW